MTDNSVSRLDSVGTTVSPARVVGVTAGLAVASAVAGSVVADVVLAAALVVSQGPVAALRDPLRLRWAGAVGAACGLVAVTDRGSDHARGAAHRPRDSRTVHCRAVMVERSDCSSRAPEGFPAPIGGAIAGFCWPRFRLR
jgi:hypothetical protein